jgi:4-amino-4-deoxy-L-arabinose transferase-like glycosyltransferase
LIIGISLFLRLLWAALIMPTMDEGYHYLYAVHPDWSYFDHPPMVMLLVRAGLELCGGAVNNLSLRLCFILMFAGSTWILARFTARWFGSWAGVYAGLLWNLAPMFSIIVGAQAMPDGPFLFFSLLTMAALAHALIDVPTDKFAMRRWIWVGLSWGGALLSKYIAVFLPAGAVLFILLTPSKRRVLRTPGPYVATLIGMVAFLPVVYWNATHDWVSFTFQAGRAVGTEFRPVAAARMLLGQIGLLTPWLWLLLTGALVGLMRHWRGQRPIEQLLVCMAVVPLTFFLAVSCVKNVHANWTMIGFVPLLPIMGQRCVAWAERWPRVARYAVAAWAAPLIVFAFVSALHTRTGLVPLPDDPAFEQSGYDSLAAELDARGLVGIPGTFIFSERWHECGQIGFALANRAPVLCYSAMDARGFAYWSRPAEWIGYDGILISLGDCPWDEKTYAPFFRHIDQVAEFWMTRAGKPFRLVRVYRCVEQLREFPYRYSVTQANWPPQD